MGFAVLRPGHPGCLACLARPGGVLGLGRVLGWAGPGEVAHGPGLGGYSRTQSGVPPRTPPADGHYPGRAGYSSSISLITYGNLGSAKPARRKRRARMAAGRQPFGVAARLCVVGVVIGPCSVWEFAFLPLSDCEIP
jgi:hypothetical protein